MGFPGVISSGQKTTLRTSGYWQRTFIAFNPGETVFQCRANEDISDSPFAEFAWDGAAVGAYTDALPGMVVYISDTATPFKDYKYRGRVRKAATAAIFYIDLNATTLEDGDYITVIRDADLFARVRNDTFIDTDVAYHNLPPMISGMPSVIVLYDSDGDGTVTYTPAQSGIAVASGATISSWAWAISGAGTKSISNAAIQAPLLTFQAGFHYLTRVIVTDSNGVSHFLITQVYAITRTFSAPVILPAAAGSVAQDLDNGYTGSITAYGGVEDLPYRTHAAVFAVEHMGDNTSTPIVTNILMHGRLRSEDIITEGSAEVGRDMQVTYPIEGITSYMQRLKVPNDIVRHQASPNEWGEMVNPTPFRMAVYALYAYTTLLNLVSFSAGDALFDAWRRGGEPVSVDGGFASDTLDTLLGFVDAAANYAPDGEIRCEINASYKVDRSALITVMDFLPTDARSIALNIDTSRSTAQVVGYGGVWNTVNNTFVLYTAQAPSIVYGDAPETREYNRSLLKYDLTTSAAITEIGARTGNDFAFNNPKWLLSMVMRDAHRWLVATNYQRYTWTITATENLREIAITTDTRWQCQSVNITINTDGTYEVSAEFVQETEFDDAQAIASQLPDNLPQLNPVYPVLSDYPADPDSPLWAMPTDTPADAELQPIDPYSGYLAYSPFTPDQAAAAAKKQGTAKCKTFQVLMRNSGTTNSPFLTVNLAAYTLKITGYGQISAEGWSQSFNMVSSDQSFIAFGTPDGGGVSATYTAGVGWTSSYYINTVYGYRGVQINRAFSSANITRISVTFTIVDGTSNTALEPFLQIYDNGGAVSLKTQFSSPAAGVGSFVWTGSITTTDIAILVRESINTPAADGGGSVTITNVTVEGIGTNPFTGLPGDAAVSADAFYFWTDEDETAQVFDATAGLLIDGNKPAVIPDYNEAHEYTVPFTGTGNAIQSAFALADYSGVDNRLITIEVCRD